MARLTKRKNIVLVSVLFNIKQKKKKKRLSQRKKEKRKKKRQRQNWENVNLAGYSKPIACKSPGAGHRCDKQTAI